MSIGGGVGLYNLFMRPGAAGNHLTETTTKLAELTDHGVGVRPSAKMKTPAALRQPAKRVSVIGRLVVASGHLAALFVETDAKTPSAFTEVGFSAFEAAADRRAD